MSVLRAVRLAAAGSLLAGIATTSPQAALASPARAATARPRLLISERDPFSGLDALRARYAKGARPSDDMPAGPSRTS